MVMPRGWRIDLRFTGEQASMDSWCNVLLDENSISARSIPLLMAGRLTVGSSGAGGCFYCGIPSHTAAECPTRTYFPSRPEIWDELAGLDLENINEAFRRIEMVLGQDSVEGYEELLEGKDDAALLMQAVLDINGPGQLRNVPRHWLYRMREPDQDEEKPTRDDSPAWDHQGRSRHQAGVPRGLKPARLPPFLSYRTLAPAD